MGTEVTEPHLGQVSLSVYSWHLSHNLSVVFIVQSLQVTIRRAR